MSGAHGVVAQLARFAGATALPGYPRDGGTIGFAMSSPEQVQAWHKAGIANGGTSIEDPPGIRQGPERAGRTHPVSPRRRRRRSCRIAGRAAWDIR